MTTSQSVLVLGAGELGTAVLHGLTNHSHRRLATITVLLRPTTIASSDPLKKEQISELQSLGIIILSGDVANDSESELATLFKSFDTIIGCTGMTSGPGTQTKIARAVLSAGVKRYIPWQFGVDYDAIGRGSAQDLFTEQLDVRDLLRAQTATNWVIVSTGMFLSFLFEPLFGVVDAERTLVRALGSWQNRVTVTTPEDIGRVTAEVVFAVPEIENEVVFTAGDTVTYDYLADAMERVLGRKVERREWSLEQLREELRTDPGDKLKKYRVVFAEGKGVAWDMQRSLNWKRGIEMVGVEEWARENLE
ncbi:MAG: hypothetical protein Q9187_000306 [Circinaria calcarea]